MPRGDTRGKRPAILIVEDVRPIADILYEELNSKGYQCFIVESAGDALVNLRVRPFDVVLLDIKLPGKSGIDLLKDISSVQPDASVIVISAVVDFNTFDEAFRRRARDYIIKPFSLETVMFIVERELSYQHMSEVWRRELWRKPSRSKLHDDTRPALSPFFQTGRNSTQHSV